MVECPTCGRTDFESERGMKCHHSIQHGESLLKDNCEVCGDEFRSTQDNRKTCSTECMSEMYQEKFKDRDIDWGDKISEARRGVSPDIPRRADIVDVECGYCEEDFSIIEWEVQNRAYCSEECRKEALSEKFSGRGNPAWRHGDHVDSYGDGWGKIAKTVRERDGECVLCGSDGGPRALDVHHIIPIREYDEPEEANVMENLVSLCRSCHMKVEWGDATINEVSA